jgi:RNA polymerase sigma-70 factor, ECF subfamily
MNAGHTALLNVHALGRTIRPTDDLVSAVRTGSPEAFAELHAIYSRRLYKTIVAITGKPEDAEDALQDAFLRAHLAFRTFEGRSHVYSWLTRIAINSALTVLRRRRACPEILFDPQANTGSEAIGLTVRDPSPNPEEVSDQHQRRLKVLYGIRKLNPSLRDPIRMQITQGLSVREIGQVLDLSDAAVKARLFRARRQLCADRDLKRQPVHRDDSFSQVCIRQEEG